MSQLRGPQYRNTSPGGIKDEFCYNDRAKSYKTLDLIAVPERVIADATAAVLVGKGKLLRVEGSAGEFIAFDSDGSLGSPGASTQNAIKMPGDFFLTVAADEFVRTSSAVRIEVVED